MTPKLLVACWFTVLLATMTLATARDKADRPEEAGGEIVDGYRLFAATDRRAYKLGETVNLTVKLTNAGDGEVSVINAAHDTTYEVDITVPRVGIGPGGETADKAPLTLKGRARAQTALHRGNHITPVAPGESVTIEMPDLNRLYDMTLSGKYTIVVRRELRSRDNNKTVEVVSNALTVQIEDRIRTEG